MNTRLEQFLAAENLSQTQFAESIDVARAGVSHLLAGRNKPSYEFIRAVMQKYPNLNMEWLILGKGKMYKDMQQEAPSPAHSPAPAAARQDEGNLLFPAHDEDSTEPGIQEDTELIPLQASSESVHMHSEKEPQSNTADMTACVDTDKHMQHAVKQRRVSKIIILFDDGSFQEM